MSDTLEYRVELRDHDVIVHMVFVRPNIPGPDEEWPKINTSACGHHASRAHCTGAYDFTGNPAESPC
jgi:hypothetical protein